MNSENKNKVEFNIPKGFYCPITKTLMVDPVIDPEGNTYERSAIEQWLSKNQTSPITRNPLQIQNLAPNINLRENIEQIRAQVQLQQLEYSKMEAAQPQQLDYTKMIAMQPQQLEYIKMTAELPNCFFDIQIENQSPFRIEFKLFWDKVPITCQNFKCLCTGENGNSKVSGKKLHYKGSKFHRIITDFLAQGGDIITGNGFGGESIFGKQFNDENFSVKHTKRGLLSMANMGPNTNGSQFFLTFIACNWLDGKHVVFGEVTSSTLQYVDLLEANGSKEGYPRNMTTIIDCGTC